MSSGALSVWLCHLRRRSCLEAKFIPQGNFWAEYSLCAFLLHSGSHLGVSSDPNPTGCHSVSSDPWPFLLPCSVQADSPLFQPGSSPISSAFTSTEAAHSYVFGLAVNSRTNIMWVSFSSFELGWRFGCPSREPSSCGVLLGFITARPCHLCVPAVVFH